MTPDRATREGPSGSMIPTVAFYVPLAGRAAALENTGDSRWERLLLDGTLLIADDSHARLTRFDTAGKVLQTLRSPTNVVDVFSSADGGWFVANVSGPTIGGKRRHRLPIHRYSSHGEVIDSSTRSCRISRWIVWRSVRGARDDHHPA